MGKIQDIFDNANKALAEERGRESVKIATGVDLQTNKMAEQVETNKELER